MQISNSGQKERQAGDNGIEIDADSRGPPWLSRLEVPILCVGNAVGSFGATAVPLWVAAIIKAGSLSKSEVGWLASSQSFSMAISILAVSWLGKYANPRWVAVAAAAVLVFSNVVSMFGTLQTLVVGRLLSGLAMGALLATVYRVAASRPNTQRVVALMEATNVLLVSVTYFVSSGLINRFGSAGLFAMLAGASVAMMIAAPLGFHTVTATPAVVARVANARKVSPSIGCLALILVCAGQNTVWTYIITIGSGLGFDGHSIGTVLGVTFPFVMLGPIAAYILGERMGLLRPLFLGLILLATDILCLVHAPSLVFFCAYAIGLHVWFVFSGPYVVALLGRLDTSGRFASATPAIVMVGASAGAALGSKVIGTGFQILSFVACSCVAAGIALFVVAAALADIQVSRADQRVARGV